MKYYVAYAYIKIAAKDDAQAIKELEGIRYDFFKIYTLNMCFDLVQEELGGMNENRIVYPKE